MSFLEDNVDEIVLLINWDVTTNQTLNDYFCIADIWLHHLCLLIQDSDPAPVPEIFLQELSVRNCECIDTNWRTFLCYINSVLYSCWEKCLYFKVNTVHISSQDQFHQDLLQLHQRQVYQLHCQHPRQVLSPEFWGPHFLRFCIVIEQEHLTEEKVSTHSQTVTVAA